MYHAVAWQIRVSGNLNYYQKSLYTVLVGAADNGAPPLTGYTNVTIVILNRNHPPEIWDQSVYIGENMPVGSTVDIPVNYTDEDLPNDIAIFSIFSGDEYGQFAIDPSSGLISLARAGFLDYENQLAPNEVVLRVVVTDIGGLFASAQITVIALDRNDPPILDRSVGPYAVDELSPPGTPIGDMLIQWTDQVGALLFSLSSASRARSESAVTAVWVFMCDVQDVNDTHVLSFVGVSPAYVIVSGGNHSLLDAIEIDPLTGNMTVSSVNASLLNFEPLFYQNATSFYPLVRIVDSGGDDHDEPPLSDQSYFVRGAIPLCVTRATETPRLAPVDGFFLILAFPPVVLFVPQTISLNQVNQPPVIWNGSFVVKDYAVPGTFVGSIRYHDPDVAVNGQAPRYVTFEILSGDPLGAFVIGGNST